jgi:hypothetical protein
MIITSTATQSQGANANHASRLGLKGDVNADGDVDISDINIVINMMLGKIEQASYCDVTGDGEVDISDVNMIINIMLGKLDNTPTMADMYQAINDCAQVMMSQYLVVQGLSGEGGIMMFYGNYPGQDFFVNLPNWDPLINQDIHEMADYRYTYYPWHYYQTLVNEANDVLKYVDRVDAGLNYKQFIKAEAMTFRAYAYLMLSQLYCKRWVDSENGAAAGLPLDLDLSNGTPERLTLAETYAMIYSELDEAIALYKASGLCHPASGWNLPDLEVAYAIYARAALTKNDWANAATYAALAREGHPLMSNDELLSDGFCNNNSEWIWGGFSDLLYYYSYHAYIAYNSSAQNVRNYPKCISRELFNQIPATDVRRQWWLDPTDNDYNTTNGRVTQGSVLDQQARDQHPDINPSSQIYAYMQWKVRCNEQPGIADLCFFRSSEMLLIEAEAQCMMGNYTAAQAALVALNKTSGRDPQYACNKTGADLLNEVKLYRRIELWGEGFDWFDLKRWKDTLVRHTYEDGGNFIEKFAVTITPEDKNEWTYVIPVEPAPAE